MLTVLAIGSVIGQAFAQPGLKINEVDYDQPGTDNAEFIELVNSSSLSIDLGLYTVLLVNGLNGSIYDSIILPSQTLNPGEMFVICGNSGMVVNCNFIIPVATDIIQNGSPDGIAIRENTSLNIIDALSYEGSLALPYVEGTGLPTAQSDNNTTAYLGISRYPDGYDTQNNSTDFIRACVTPGAGNVNVSSNCQSPTPVHNYEVSSRRMFMVPNPAATVVSFFGLSRSQSNREIIFYDISGKCVKKISAPASGRVMNADISALEPGMYFVTVHDDDAPGYVGQSKLIIQR